MSGKLPGTWKEVDEDYIPYLKEKKNSPGKGKDEVYTKMYILRVKIIQTKARMYL